MANMYHKQLLEVDMTLHTVPFEMGFAPTPWEPMTDFELLKKTRPLRRRADENH